MSLAYSRKHWRQMSSAYLRMMPFWLPHTRLHAHTHTKMRRIRQRQRAVSGRASVQQPGRPCCRASHAREPQAPCAERRLRLRSLRLGLPRCAPCRRPHVRTTHGRPCRSSRGESSTRPRTPWLRRERDEEGRRARARGVEEELGPRHRTGQNKKGRTCRAGQQQNTRRRSLSDDTAARVVADCLARACARAVPATSCAKKRDERRLRVAPGCLRALFCALLLRVVRAWPG
jgi:hypothetical protein